MIPKISKITELQENVSNAIIIDTAEQISMLRLTENQKDYLIKKHEKENEGVVYYYPNLLFTAKIKQEKNEHQAFENARIAGSKLFEILKTEKIRVVQIQDFTIRGMIEYFLEGLLLSGYSFSKYKKEKDEFLLDEIKIFNNKISDIQIVELEILARSVFKARDLVNEPLVELNALKFAAEMEKMGLEANFTVEIFNKQKIEALKMGGLLAVNKGSIDPPTFTIMEWKPENTTNIKPVILIGKGIVFDTGGLSLKPTQKSMDYMKCDMAGGAVVAATIYAAAKNKIPLHIIGFVPATDNRPDGNAYVPGDIITMHDNTTVEIKNTDAEGRLILADALSYAKKYLPLLVIDIATLTGSAEIIAGNQAFVAMGNSAETLAALKNAGEKTYERLIELPLWDEYAKPLKSEIADLNNIGTREGQSTITGKFLEHFTDYPWIHLDSAGISFLFEKNGYRQAGGSGTGVRMLYYFLKNFK